MSFNKIQSELLTDLLVEIPVEQQEFVMGGKNCPKKIYHSAKCGYYIPRDAE
jgi:hypothetical protein